MMPYRTTALVVALAVPFGAAQAETLGLGTTAPGGVVHSNGVAVAKVLVDKAGLEVVVQPQGGSAERNVAAGIQQLSVTNSFDLSFFVNGKGDYEGQPAHKNIKIITPMNPSRITGWVKKNSDIKGIPDLKGKRVSGGFTAQKTIRRVYTALLANGGLSYKDVDVVPVPSIARSTVDFGAGKTDVMFFGVGTARVKQVNAALGGIRPIPVDDSQAAVARMLMILPGAYTMVLQPGTDSLITKPVPILSYDILLYTNDSVSEDVVYKMTKALHDNKELLAATYVGNKLFDPKAMAKQYAGLQHHPGAIKYYKEIGIWPKDGQ